MPRKDRTGPLGHGAATGRGLGPCDTGRAECKGMSGFGAGFRRRDCKRLSSCKSLSQQKAILESRLDEINRQLDK